MKTFGDWFGSQGWEPFDFQQEAWRAIERGHSGLVHAPTGFGKTYAVLGGLIGHWLSRSGSGSVGALGTPSGNRTDAEPLRVLWVTPMRALANDTLLSLARPIADMELPWTAELRHGDTSSHRKKKQRECFPTVLVTTPESLSLLLSYPDTRDKFQHLVAVVVDEWHELLGTKRGVQTELALARLRTWRPGLMTWGLSATLGNIMEAQAVLMGPAAALAEPKPLLLKGEPTKRIEVETIVPDSIERFPWAGHLGLRQAPAVAMRIQVANTTLVFTNTRSQSELWYRTLAELLPDGETSLAIHHGSLDLERRAEVEARVARGELRVVVCTSSLDLGVDFSPVDQVIQIGSPKGIARMMQRAGRSGHQPRAVSRLVGVPTNAFELAEFAAAREAMERLEVETRAPLREPLDVLVQHLVTVALGGGFESESLREEVRSTYAYSELGTEEWSWALDFVCRGGRALGAYPDFCRVVPGDDGRYRVTSQRVARLHRMGIGTITSDSEVSVRYSRGQRLGSIEESFVSRLKPGDVFNFSGRRLQLVRFREMTAFVRNAPARHAPTPAWQGGRSPLSTELAAAVLRKLSQTESQEVEMRALRALLKIQAHGSRIPDLDTTLAEVIVSRKTHNLFVYPFAGRLAHEGLAVLAAYRLSRQEPLSLRVTVNDYGFCLQSPRAFEVNEARLRYALGTDNLLEDLLACINATEMARRQFREISRVAGLVLQGYPGQRKPARQLQVSAGLLFEVFERYDPENRLLQQAHREILSRQLDLTRLAGALRSIEKRPLSLVYPRELTPMCFPLWAEQLAETLSSESWRERVARLAETLETKAVPAEPAGQVTK